MPIPSTGNEGPRRRDQRRRDRLAVPTCQSCGSPATTVVSRTDYVVYVRGTDCSWVWGLPKPGHAQVMEG